MDKVLASYAVLDFFSDKKKDIIDVYIPLIVRTICQNNLDKFDRDVAHDYFVKEYGLTSMTIGAIDSILNRMCNQKLLTRSNGEFLVDNTQLANVKVWNDNAQIESSFDNLIVLIQQFAKTEFALDINETDIENGLFDFLDGYNQDIVLDFGQFNAKLMQLKGRKVNLKYIISKFIVDANKQGVNLDVLVRIAKGHLLSQTISLDNLASFSGKMKNVKVALDTPILYNLLGLNNSSALDLSVELMKLLKEQDVSFCMFRHNYDEAINTLQDAATRLRNNDYDLSKSSRVLIYAVTNHLNANFLQMKISEVEHLFENWDIVLEDAPNSQVDYMEIDEYQLGKNIEEIYKQHGNGHLPKYVEELIEIDVKSLVYIFRLRGNSIATSLKNCKAILLTNNKAIACASADEDLSLVKHMVPVCMTDVFLSTILWICFPKRNDVLNKKLLLSLCASNINIDSALLSRYYNRIKEMYQDGVLTSEQVAELTMKNAAINLLEKKTMNSAELFTDMTPMEILQDMENIQKRQVKKYEQDELKRDEQYRKIAMVIANILYWVVWTILFGLFLIKGVWGVYTTGVNWLDLPLCIIGLFLSVWGILNWGGFIPSRLEIQTYFSSKIYKCLKEKFEGTSIK